MKTLYVVFSLLTVSLATSACGHLPHKVVGNEPASTIPEGVRVRIGEKEVKEGERVNVFTTSCQKEYTPSKGGTEKSHCTRNKVGEAVVVKILDHDSAIVNPNPGLVMSTEMTVEKQ